MTQIRINMRQNADEGVQAVANLTQYGYHFSQQMNARMNGVDMTMPENQPFAEAVKQLQEEFGDYMDKIAASNPSALAALASQVSQFDQKLAALPQAFRKTKVRKTAYPTRQYKHEASNVAQEQPPPLG